MIKNLAKLIIVFVFGVFWYVNYYPTLRLVLLDKYFEYKKCQKPVTYKIVDIDSRFNLKIDDAKKVLESAEDVWEIPYSKNIFEYTDKSADINVHFVFDERQETANELEKLDSKISTEKNSLDFERLSFNEMKVRYESDANELRNLVTRYNSASLNQQDRARLYNTIKEKEVSLKNLEQELRSAADKVNQNVDQLNNVIGDYNSISGTQGEAFNEGEFVYDKGKKDIYIYHFTSNEVLKRLFAHELGHALGMDHVEGTGSIMYYLNSSKNIIPTEGDLNELSAVCQK